MLALVSTVLVWISFQWLPLHVSADAQAAVFLAWSLPLAAWLGVRLLVPWRPALSVGPGPGPSSAAAGAQETTVSSLGRLVSTS